MRRLAMVVLSGWVWTGSLAACGGLGGGAPSTRDRAYLSELQGDSPQITAVRSDSQLIRLGQAVCADLSAGASYGEVADRLALVPGASSLSPEDLGAVITSAADNYCPRYRSRL